MTRDRASSITAGMTHIEAAHLAADATHNLCKVRDVGEKLAVCALAGLFVEAKAARLVVVRARVLAKANVAAFAAAIVQLEAVVGRLSTGHSRYGHCRERR